MRLRAGRRRVVALIRMQPETNHCGAGDDCDGCTATIISHTFGIWPGSPKVVMVVDGAAYAAGPGGEWAERPLSAPQRPSRFHRAPAGLDVAGEADLREVLAQVTAAEPITDEAGG